MSARSLKHKIIEDQAHYLALRAVIKSLLIFDFMTVRSVAGSSDVGTISAADFCCFFYLCPCTGVSAQRYIIIDKFVPRLLHFLACVGA